ncbi:WXG100 family type VII secretion target [Streptomyces zhihengii]
MLERLPDMFGGLFGIGSNGSVFGSTAFDGFKLNVMLDFLESANPEHLEGASEALVKANADINRAAEDLAKTVGDVNWEGEGAEEFRRYGAEVVSYAWAIAKMANAAGTQMKVASEGLASVRNSRPPRDDRVIKKDAKDFAVPEQTADNPDYQKALQVEKNRQEAINQMNRLASFYAVSEGTLAGQEMPKPPEGFRAAVPQPAGGVKNGSGVTAITPEPVRRSLRPPSSPPASPARGTPSSAPGLPAGWTPSPTLR